MVVQFVPIFSALLAVVMHNSAFRVNYTDPSAQAYNVYYNYTCRLMLVNNYVDFVLLYSTIFNYVCKATQTKSLVSQARPLRFFDPAWFFLFDSSYFVW